jgi:hypothetical protein
MCVLHRFLFPDDYPSHIKVGRLSSKPREKISVFTFHKPNICRKPAVVHLAEQNNHPVAMNRNT